MAPRRAFKREEVAIFEQMPSNRTKLLLIMGIYSGFRISELLSLRVGDLFDNGIIKKDVSVKKENMKNKKAPHSVPIHALITETLPEILTCVRFSDLPIFPSRQGKHRNQALSRRQALRNIHFYCALYGITGNIGTHSVRKSFAMHLYKSSHHNILGVSKALGHKSVTTTMKYLEVETEEIRGWMANM